MSVLPERTGERIAAIGTFDGVHRGHRAMLLQMQVLAALEGYVPMVVTFDRHPLEEIAPERAPGLLMSLSERTSMLRSCLGSIVLLRFDEGIRRLTAREFMKLLRDRYNVGAVFMGFNHYFGSDRLRDPADYRREAESLGMKVFMGSEEPDDEGGLRICSTEIRQRLSAGDVASASRLLGRPYRLIGRVGEGKRIGRTIGFPTANVVPLEDRQLVPSGGVYACWATLSDGRRVAAVVNIGCRPTVSSDGRVTIEAHLLDFSGDLYGCGLTLDFVARIRDERKFDGLEELRVQLGRDVEAARKILCDAQ